MARLCNSQDIFTESSKNTGGRRMGRYDEYDEGYSDYPNAGILKAGISQNHYLLKKMQNSVQLFFDGFVGVWFCWNDLVGF